MLKSLTIKNIGIITDLSVAFGNGLNIITGETGTGKSMILSALDLILGGRADTDVLRQGAEQALAEGVFDAKRTYTAAAILEPLGIIPEDGELVVRRTIQKEGKSRAIVNGSSISLADLKSAGETMVDIHGQHDHQSLLNRATHLSWLDAYLSLESEQREFSVFLSDLRRLESVLQEITQKQEESEAQREFLKFKLEDLEMSDLRDNEEAQLESDHRRLASAGRIRESGEKIFQELYEAEGSALSRVQEAMKEVERLKVADPFFETVIGRLADSASQLSDLAREIHTFSSKIDDDPGHLSDVESRLALIERLKRKYRTDYPGLIRMRDETRNALASLETAGQDRDKVEALINESRRQVETMARSLHLKRTRGIATIKKEVQREFSDLNMEGARFDVEVTLEADEADGIPLDGSRRKIFDHGFGEFQFTFSANLGQELKPLAKIGSGGEISRVMLSLKTAVGKRQPVPILVFDEVDSGIGGKTADLVGEKLKKLSKTCQIICITHLPQIARQADHHFVVEKTQAKGVTLVQLTRLTQNGRVEELARMGGGKVITDAAREHAKEMIGK